MFMVMSEENWLACEPAWHRGELIYEKKSSREPNYMKNSSHERIHKEKSSYELIRGRFHLVNTLSRRRVP